MNHKDVFRIARKAASGQALFGPGFCFYVLFSGGKIIRKTTVEALKTFAPKGQLRGMIMPNYVMTMKTISNDAKYLYASLCDYAGIRDHCWPSQKALADRLNCSISSIKKYIRQLVAEKLIHIEYGERGCRYFILQPQNLTCSKYEGVSKINGSPARKESSQGASEFTSGDHQNLPPGGVKFGSYPNLNKQEYIPPLPPLQPKADPVPKAGSVFFSESRKQKAEAEDAFGQVWAVYPKREAKELARASWHKLWRQGELPPQADILAAIRLNISRNAAWQKESGRFVPLLGNWLRGRRWQDDFVGTSLPSSSLEKYLQTQKLLQSMQDCAQKSVAPTEFEAMAEKFALSDSKRALALGLWRHLECRGIDIISVLRRQSGDMVETLKQIKVMNYGK